MLAILVDAIAVREMPGCLGEFLDWLNRQSNRYCCYVLDRGGLPAIQESVARVIPFPPCPNSGSVAESGLIQRIMALHGIRIFVQTGKTEPLASAVIQLWLRQFEGGAPSAMPPEGNTLVRHVVASDKDDKFNELVELLLDFSESVAGRDFFDEWLRLRQIEAEIGDA
jgi:hypothetical protein